MRVADDIIRRYLRADNSVLDGIVLILIAFYDLLQVIYIRVNLFGIISALNQTEGFQIDTPQSYSESTYTLPDLN